MTAYSATRASLLRPNAARSRSPWCRCLPRSGCRRFLTAFTRRFPGVKIRATDQRSPQVRAMVADGSVDIGVAGVLCRRPEARLPPDRDRHVRRAVPARSSARQAAQTDLLERAAKVRRVIGNDAMELLKDRGLGKWIESPSLVVTSRASLMACVKAGLGVTVVPLLTKAEKALRPAVHPAGLTAHIAHHRHRHAARPNPASDGRAHARNAGPVAARLCARPGRSAGQAILRRSMRVNERCGRRTTRKSEGAIDDQAARNVCLQRQ